MSMVIPTAVLLQLDEKVVVNTLHQVSRYLDKDSVDNDNGINALTLLEITSKYVTVLYKITLAQFHLTSCMYANKTYK